MKIVPQWWRTHFLLCELVVALLSTTGFVYWVELRGGAIVLSDLLAGNRAAIYGALASIFGSLLGFVITAISIVLGFSSDDRLAIIRGSKHYRQLWAVFTAATKALGLATLSALAGLVFDRESHPLRCVLEITIFVSVLSFFRLARCIWVLERIIELLTSPSAASAQKEPS